jgi:tetratricopeptide (TPR) repeat protein
LFVMFLGAFGREGGSWLRAGLCAALLLAALAHASLGQIIVAPSAGAAGAPGGRVPSPLYFNALPAYYDGHYRDALGAFVSASRNSIKSANRQWIDSIPYFAMAGECYYQMGQPQQALEQYNAALKLFVAHSDWMMRVQFPPTIGPAPNPVRVTPWGQSKRGAAVGAFPETYNMTQGQLDQTAIVQQGGALQPPVIFPISAVEIIRTTALAIRRRRELMGPVGKHDPLTASVLDVLTRRPGPPNHWSQSWVNVQLGCAYAAAGSLPQAKTALENAVLAAGQFDHPLTSTALVELARLALEAGDYTAAGRYAEEATYACANFPDPNNLEEAFRLGFTAHLLLNQKGAYPLLAPAVAWSKTEGTRHVHTSLLLSAAESAATLGDTAQAAGYLDNARLTMSRSEQPGGRLGARMNHLAAQVAYQGGAVPDGDRALAAALAFQRKASLWAFQIALADAYYLGGNASDRVALLVYEEVLRDPTAADWAANPLECLSLLHTPHGAALENWFELSLKNAKEQELALEIADRARRHRFFSTLPMGGRLLSVRWILEGPPEVLGERGLLERQDLLARYPKYAKLAAEAAQLRAKLAAIPLADDAADARRRQAELLTNLAQVSQAQEVVLREIAVRREAADMVFPPLRKTADVQQSLPEGQVLLAFFATSRNLYAFLFSRDRYAAWRVQSPVQLKSQMTLMLREMGNYEPNRELTAAELAKDGWRAAGAKVIKLLLARSNVELTGNFDEIVIVPDGFLWYLPFEATFVGPPDEQKLLISQARVRYAPTVGLAVPYGRWQKPRPNVGVALGKLHPQDDDSASADAFRRLGAAVGGVVALPRALPAPSAVYRVLLDGLIVLDDIEPAAGPYDWSPLQIDRGKTTDTLESWFALPWGGPEQVILPGYHTAAESGARRGKTAGDEMFLAICGLMSAGARTILISRWRTGGQTSLELVREFSQELPTTTAADAWQRSVEVVSQNPIEPDREPRVQNSSARDPRAKADHPFFWAGYLLVDSGARPASDDEQPQPGGKVAAQPQPANPPPGGAAAPPLPAGPAAGAQGPDVKTDAPEAPPPKKSAAPKAAGRRPARPAAGG